MEYIMPQVSSTKFCYVAENDGKVLEVKPNNYIAVEYKDGRKRYYDLSSRLSSTKRASYIELPMNSLDEGVRFKKNQLLAWADSFNGESYVYGRNLCIAIMNYMGSSFEDGYVLNQEASEKYEVSALDEIHGIIPSEAKLIYFNNNNGVDTKPGEVLLEFGYNYSVDDYIDNFGLNGTDENEFNPYDRSKDSIKVKSPGGRIKKIKIFINNKASVDSSILLAWQKQVKELKSKKRKLEQGRKHVADKLAASDNIDLSVLKTG
jgi:hypothetical protein